MPNQDPSPPRGGPSAHPRPTPLPLQQRNLAAEKPDMVRFFERGREYLRVETRRDNTSGEFVLILHQADGTRLVDRFKNEGKFRKRLGALERQLLAARWTSKRSLHL